MARVTVIVDPEFGAQLEPFAFRNPVWVVESETNRAAAEEAWRRAVEWPQISVTVFQFPAAPAKDDWLHLVELIGLHYAPLAQPRGALQVFGTELTPALRAALDEAGFVLEPGDGVRARRS